jgi:hypothetical protein
MEVDIDGSHDPYLWWEDQDEWEVWAYVLTTKTGFRRKLTLRATTRQLAALYAQMSECPTIVAAADEVIRAKKADDDPDDEPEDEPEDDGPRIVGFPE